MTFEFYRLRFIPFRVANALNGIVESVHRADSTIPNLTARIRVGFTALGRLMAIAFLVIIIPLGSISMSSQRAIAATDPNTAPYDAGPIRKSRNPVSNENFQGGVDQSALEQKERTSESQIESPKDKNLMDTLKDLLPGKSSESEHPSPQSRFDPERNPTLERYTEQGGL